jgi:hypothetical protein
MARPKSPEQDYPASGPQPELPAELLPTPADGTVPSISEGRPQVIEPPEESAFQPPASIRSQVKAVAAQADFDYDRVDSQGQTTDFGTRERSNTLTPEDEDVLIARAARRVLLGNPKSRKPKTRRGLGPRQLLSADEAPPHIVEETRRARGEL